MDVAAFKVSHYVGTGIDIDATTLQASGVVMDIAAFKVCHSFDIEKDATTLRAARARSSSTSIGAQGKFKMRAHI